jgi:hypothetical protein
MTRKQRARYAVVLAKRMDDIPADTLHELRATLEAIAQACEMVPASSPFWTSVAGSDLVVDIMACRFVYSVDRVGKTITVKSCKPSR